jgi:hypothetical protein
MKAVALGECPAAGFQLLNQRTEIQYLQSQLLGVGICPGKSEELFDELRGGLGLAKKLPHHLLVLFGRAIPFADYLRGGADDCDGCPQSCGASEVKRVMRVKAASKLASIAFIVSESSRSSSCAAGTVMRLDRLRSKISRVERTRV